jgi:uncharacterized repeat protein (TIGR02543 family)
MNHKQQSALEFISVYSWAILIVALFIGVVSVLALSKPLSGNLASSCNIQPLLPCMASAITYNAINPLHYELIFTNNLGVPMYFPSNGFNLTTTNLGSAGILYSIGNCTPSIALPGTPVVCQANIAGSLKPQVGSQTTTLFVLNYQLCKNGLLSTCQGTVYRSTGTSLQTVAPTSTALYTITFLDNPTSGTIVLNGVTYVNNAASYFSGQSYNAFALPPPGYVFAGWSISSATSTLTNTITQSTVLNLNSNAVITAVFSK